MGKGANVVIEEKVVVFEVKVRVGASRPVQGKKAECSSKGEV